MVGVCAVVFFYKFLVPLTVMVDAKVQLPTEIKKPWFMRGEVGVLASNLVPAAAIAVATGLDKHNGYSWVYYLASSFLTVSVVLQLAVAHRREKRESKKDEMLDLTGCLLTMRAAIVAWKKCSNGNGSDTDCRITMHRSVAPYELEQIVDYVGGPGRGGKRRIPGRGGVVGRCVTTLIPAVMHRKNENLNEYYSELRQNWGMTDDEVSQLSKDRMSFMGRSTYRFSPPARITAASSTVVRSPLGKSRTAAAT